MVIVQRCRKSCITCKENKFQHTFKSTVTGREYKTINKTNKLLNCSSRFIVYLITCSQCKVQYVGITRGKLGDRMSNHRSTIKLKEWLLIGEHFNNSGRCSLKHLKVQPIEQITGGNAKLLLERENFWIKELRTLTPYGLNDKLGSKNWRTRTRDDIAGLCFNKMKVNRGCRGRKRRGPKNKIETKFSDIMKVVVPKYEAFENWRFTARCMINEIKIKNLYTLSWDFVDTSMNYASKYPIEIINLILDLINHRLYIHKLSESSKPRTHFLKIYFQGKDIEKLKLNKIIRKNLKLLPDELNWTTTLIFTRSKTIGSKIFNYKKVVQNVITNNYQPDSINFPDCNCDSSPFIDPNHGHIVTNNLKVIDCQELRSLLMKGPKYREP